MTVCRVGYTIPRVAPRRITSRSLQARDSSIPGRVDENENTERAVPLDPFSLRAIRFRWHCEPRRLTRRCRETRDSSRDHCSNHSHSRDYPRLPGEQRESR